MKTIHCKTEPFRCQSDNSFCRMDDYGRGHKLPPYPIWCGTGKQYRKQCDICMVNHIYTDITPVIVEPPKKPSIFGFHTGRVP